MRIIPQMHAFRTLGWLLYLSLAVLLSACGRTDPEKALRAAITDMEAAVKARDTSKFVAHLAPDFAQTGSAGLNRDDVRRTIAGILITNPNIYLNASISEVKISGESATAKLVVVAGGGSGLIPERAQSWNFTTRWRYEKDKWLVERADWTELL